MTSCPFQNQEQCVLFFGRLAQSSQDLRDRAESHYCNGDYRTCARYAYLKAHGATPDLADIGPWDRPGGSTASA